MESSQLRSLRVNFAKMVCGSSFRKGPSGCWFVCWRGHEIISRDELRQRLWPDGTFVDFDHNISSAINKLRTVMNDSASNPRFIETWQPCYRFLADV